jgi:hypothetical protein
MLLFDHPYVYIWPAPILVEQRQLKHGLSGPVSIPCIQNVGPGVQRVDQQRAAHGIGPWVTRSLLPRQELHKGNSLSLGTAAQANSQPEPFADPEQSTLNREPSEPSETDSEKNSVSGGDAGSEGDEEEECEKELSGYDWRLQKYLWSLQAAAAEVPQRWCSDVPDSSNEDGAAASKMPAVKKPDPRQPTSRVVKKSAVKKTAVKMPAVKNQASRVPDSSDEEGDPVPLSHALSLPLLTRAAVKNQGAAVKNQASRQPPAPKMPTVKKPAPQQSRSRVPDSSDEEGAAVKNQGAAVKNQASRQSPSRVPDSSDEEGTDCDSDSSDEVWIRVAGRVVQCDSA